MTRKSGWISAIVKGMAPKDWVPSVQCQWGRAATAVSAVMASRTPGVLLPSPQRQEAGPFRGLLGARMEVTDWGSFAMPSTFAVFDFSQGPGLLPDPAG